jgi:methyl-accepting chemotaxis protein
MAFRRRNYFTKKEFQTRFLVPFMAASLLANFITVTLFIILARRKIDGLLYSMWLPPASAGSLLSPVMLAASLASVAAVSLLFLWMGRSMHQRIAGPLSQIRADIGRVRDGDLTFRITLREMDEFKDFAAEINAMTTVLNERFSVLRKQAYELAGEANALKASPDAASAGAHCRRLQGTIRHMEEQIGSFTV